MNEEIHFSTSLEAKQHSTSLLLCFEQYKSILKCITFLITACVGSVQQPMFLVGYK